MNAGALFRLVNYAHLSQYLRCTGDLWVKTSHPVIERCICFGDFSSTCQTYCKQ